MYKTILKSIANCNMDNKAYLNFYKIIIISSELKMITREQEKFLLIIADGLHDNWTFKEFIDRGLPYLSDDIL